MFTWSKGLKTATGIGNRTDEEIIAGNEGIERHVATIKGEAWDVIRDVSGAAHRLLAAAEESSHAVREFLVQLALWPPGYDPLAPP